MELTEFWTICSANGIVLEKEQLWDFERYRDELKYWNSKVNLISRKDEDNIFERHILHSLSILKYVNIPKKARCLDVGTGGGLPGIPVKIARPDLFITMVDSIAKKIKITDMLAAHTGHRNIEALCTRAEDLAKKKKYSRYFDFIFARAVTKISSVYSWVKDSMKPGAQIILLKGGDLTGEIAQAKEDFPKLNILEMKINLIGADWINNNDKKIVICRKN